MAPVACEVFQQGGLIYTAFLTINWPAYSLLATLLGVWGVESYGSYQPRGVSAQNQFIEDQLDRADAGSWQIADGGDTVGTGSSFAHFASRRVEPYK